jgi:hypothetical protein
MLTLTCRCSSTPPPFLGGSAKPGFSVVITPTLQRPTLSLRPMNPHLSPPERELNPDQMRGHAHSPRPIRILVDDSLFSGSSIYQRSSANGAFFERLNAGAFHLLASTHLLAKLLQNPTGTTRWYEYLHFKPVIVSPNQTTTNLLQAYNRADLMPLVLVHEIEQLALATVHGCDWIVSWNFQRLQEGGKIARYNEINLTNNYPAISILSPEQVLRKSQETYLQVFR